jgi:hypothetical protein
VFHAEVIKEGQQQHQWANLWAGGQSLQSSSGVGDSSCSWGVPDGKDMNIEAEESPLLGAATKQQAHEGTSDWENLACAMVICRGCELVTA